MAVGVFLAVVVFLCSSGSWSPSTPRGVQCPTAAVQTVTEVAMVRNCCGKLVAKTFQHAPREGEVGFKQCRCAEKRAADAQGKSESAESARPALTLAILGPIFCFAGVPDLPKTTHEFFEIPRSSLSPVSAPATPPPQFV